MTTAQLLSFYKPLVGTRLNFVTNPSLSFRGSDNTSAALSNDVDRALLKHLRSISNLVITDSATAQIEHYKPSKLAEIEIWSRSGDFGTLATTAANPPFFKMSLKLVTNIAQRIGELRESHPSILFESGPTFSRVLGKSQLVDELCLTVTSAPDEAAALQTGQQWSDSFGFDYLTMQTCLEADSAFFLRLAR